MTFNAAELEEAIEALGETRDEDGDSIDEYYGGVWGYVADAWDDSEFHKVTVNPDTRTIEGVLVKIVEISTGTYDDDTYIILEVHDEGGNVRNFRKFGWTASHDGTYWEGSFSEVEPYEKVEKYWRKKK